MILIFSKLVYVSQSKYTSNKVINIIYVKTYFLINKINCKNMFQMGFQYDTLKSTKTPQQSPF